MHLYLDGEKLGVNMTLGDLVDEENAFVVLDVVVA
jgi:hypothetical protein